MLRVVMLAVFGLMATVLAVNLVSLDKDGILDSDTLKEFSSFKSRFNRACSDGSAECKRKKQAFKANLKKLKTLNATKKKGGAEYGITEYLDWDPEELKKLVFNIDTLPAPLNISSVDAESRSKRANIGTKDWRATQAVNPIRNQGSCGSCWAFASVAAIEIQSNFLNKRTGAKRRAYSEQHLLNCVAGNTCNGGWPITAMTYAKTKGLARAVNQKYTGKIVACPKKLAVDKPVANVLDMTGKLAQMQSYVQNTGPITAAFYVCNDFYMYTGGVYRTQCTYDNPEFVGGHAVAIIGFGTTADGIDYWLVRNSWGVNWGINGYFMIERGTDTSYFESWGVSGPKAAKIA
ncbi:unnamed protein product, partial [Mesorhabditis spiculigera]